MHRPVRSRSICRRPEQLLEHLESRLMLNGLTLITHGYEPFSNSRPSWIDAMGTAIAQIAGPTTSIYALRLEATNSTTVHVSQFTRLSGPDSTDSTNGENVLLLDWASVSGILTQTYSVAYLASVVTPYLEQANPSIGLSAPLAEGSIQLIGHSRGAPLVSEIARDLGQAGIWVDQVTTLDPVPSPFNSDPAVNLGTNVIFADNYYQNAGDGFLVPNGSRVSGAVNLGPLSLGGAYSILDGSTHNDVHLFYQGTIGSSTSDGSHSVPSSWYASNNVVKTSTGFYYSRLEGGIRPASGVASAFGGTAGRSSIMRSGVQWPNLVFVTPSTNSIISGQSFSASFRYQDYNAQSTVQWFLDPDTSPYDGNSIPLGNATNFAATGNTIANGNASLTAPVPAGTYFLEGLITNGTQTRYAYASAPVTVTTTPTQLAIVQQPTTAVAGFPITTSLIVDVEDAQGHLTNDNSMVTLSIASNSGTGTLGGNLTVQAKNGVATFSGLSLSAAGNYTLQVADGTLTPATSDPITVAPPPPHLVFTQQPASSVIGVNLAPALIVTITDPNGLTLTTDNSIVTLTLASGPGTLKGTLSVQAQNGVATFNNVTLSKSGNYTLQATDTGFTAAVSPTILVTLPATHLVFIQQPTNAIAGQTIGPALTVAIEDSANHIVASDSSNISIAIFSGPTGTGGTFNGTLSVQAQNGIATFDDLALSRAGSYTFYASDGALTGSRSRGFSISPDTSSAYLVLVQTSNTTIVGKPLSPSILVNVKDQFGNLIPTARSAVTLSIAAGPGGTIAGTSTVTLSNASATFNNANVTMAGTYTLQASDSALAVTTPVTFVQVITPGITTVPTPGIAGSYPYGITSFTTTLRSTAGTAIPFTGQANLVDQDNNLLGVANLTAAGKATFSLLNLALGNYVCHVVYPGDASHTAASSSTFTLHIVAASTSTTLTASATQLVAGQSLTLTATVNATSAPTTPRTGAITFKEGSTVLAIVPLDQNSTATLTIANPTIGGHNYTAVYSGDSNFKISTSGGRGISVKKDNTLVTLTSSAVGPVAPGDLLTLTAVVSVLSPGVGIATGSIVFKDGNKILGTVTLDNTGTATLNTSLTIVGTHRLTASYAGDSLDNASASALLTVTVLI